MTSRPVALRIAGPADAEALARLGQEAFAAAFGALYRPEDLAVFSVENRSPERARADLADPRKRVCFAQDEAGLAGYCLIAFGQAFAGRPDPQPQRPVCLSQLYCLPRATGQGIGAALLGWATGQARGWGADAVQLSVFSENSDAQRFYRRHGFEHVADISLWVGNKRDDEYLYELPLRA